MGGGDDDDEAADSWLSDQEIITASEQMYPAVLLRFLRLATSIRMAVRGSWPTWCLIYAARGAERSWVTSLLQDVQWLSASTSTFASLNSSSLAEWLRMAKAGPARTLAALKKACVQPKAATYAEGLACGYDNHESDSEQQVPVAAAPDTVVAAVAAPAPAPAAAIVVAAIAGRRKSQATAPLFSVGGVRTQALSAR